MFFILITIFTIIIIIYIICAYKFNYWKTKGVYQIKPTKPLGNILNKKICLGECMKVLYDECRWMKKPYGGFYLSVIPILLLTDPELIKTILVKDYKSFYNRGFNHVSELSKNLVFLRDKKWKRIRSKISPAFTQNKMLIIFDNLIECSENLDIVLNKPEDEPIDIQDIIGRLTLDNIGLSTFGFRSDTLIETRSKYYEMAEHCEKLIFKNRTTDLCTILPVLHYFYKPIHTFLNRGVSKYFTDLIRKNIKHREDNNVYKNDFIDLFIEIMKKQTIHDDPTTIKSKYDPLSFDELVTTAFSFYIGGFHTTELSLTFGLLQLSLNQNVQDKLRKNINDTLGRHQGNVTYESVMEMEYLEQVIFEILRMYPIIPVLFRECNENYKVPNTDLIIDKGTKVWIPTLGLHMDPEYYSNPTEFNPDRFTQERIDNRKPFTYLPFGEGHRICIGKRFGLLQMKIALVKLIQSRRFTVDPKMTQPVGFEGDNLFLGPKNKIWLNVKKITDM